MLLTRYPPLLAELTGRHVVVDQILLYQQLSSLLPRLVFSHILSGYCIILIHFWHRLSLLVNVESFSSNCKLFLLGRLFLLHCSYRGYCDLFPSIEFTLTPLLFIRKRLWIGFLSRLVYSKGTRKLEVHLITHKRH